MPTGVVGGETSVPDFKFSPEAPKQLETVTFDASDPQLDQTLTKYEWDFGDGSKGQGRVASHQYRDIDSYAVTLTVTDIAGLKGSRSKTVPVGTSGVPTASFVFSPSSPGIGEDIVFNGAGSSVAPPRTIVKYAWDFGTGSKASGMVVKKTYDTAGQLQRVADGDRRRRQHGNDDPGGDDWHVSPGGLAAAFTFSPTAPLEDTVVNFNATTSTSADPITNYKWDFGDGGTASTAAKTTSHTFDQPGHLRRHADDSGFQGTDGHDDQERTVTAP